MKKILFFCTVIHLWSCKSDSNIKIESDLNKDNRSVLESNMDSISYVLGNNTIQLLYEKFPQINTEAFNQAMKDYINKVDMKISDSLGTILLDKLQKQMQDENIAKMEALIKSGEEFLYSNGKRKEVVTTKTGLQYEIIRKGNGKKPIVSDNVKTNYHVTLIDGTVFDSSLGLKEPISLNVGDVIAGWTEALQLMSVGSKWKLFIPYYLAYGERGLKPLIDPFSTVIIEVELLEIIN